MKRERLRRGWSLQTLGFHTGMQGAEISKIERRLVVPYPTQRQRLARHLGLAAEGLLEEVDEGEESEELSTKTPAASRR
jgi:transcriptional regulator with XRE-family HTH domain